MTVTRAKYEWVDIPTFRYGGVKKGRRPSHVISIRDGETGEIVEQAEFHGFEDYELDAAIEAHVAVLEYGAKRDGFLWGKVFNNILSRTDPTFERCQRPEPITNDDLVGRFIQWRSPRSTS